MSAGILRPPLSGVSAGAAGAALCTAVLPGPSCWNAGQPGRFGVCMLLLSAALPRRQTGVQAQMLSRKQDVLLEPGAGCWLWPLVLQTPGSAHADANLGLRSTQLSAFDAGRASLHKGTFWSNLSFFALRPVEHVFKGRDSCLHLTAMGAGLLFQGKGGLGKPQVRPCLGAPKQLHSARTPWQPAEAGAVVLLLNDFRI